jgi:hypothetical protein
VAKTKPDPNELVELGRASWRVKVPRNELVQAACGCIGALNCCACADYGRWVEDHEKGMWLARSRRNTNIMQCYPEHLLDGEWHVYGQVIAEPCAKHADLDHDVRSLLSLDVEPTEQDREVARLLGLAV